MKRHEIFFVTTSYIRLHLEELLERIKEEMSEIKFFNTEMIENDSEKDLKLFFFNFEQMYT